MLQCSKTGVAENPLAGDEFQLDYHNFKILYKIIAMTNY